MKESAHENNQKNEKDNKKEKKINEEIQMKIDRNNELLKIADDFNQNDDFDCDKFIECNNYLKYANKKSKSGKKKKQKNNHDQYEQKQEYSINDIKEMEEKVAINEHPKKKKSTWRLITMITLNGIFFFVELIVGISTHSLALQTDAFNMLSDEASVIIGLVVHQYSKKNSSNRMAFGYVRAETIGGLCNSVFMYAVALTIFLDAIELFVDPHEIEHSSIFLIVGILGLLVNLIGIIVFVASDNDNIKGVFIHTLGDFLGSVGVLISALVQNFCNSKILKMYIDPVISIIIALFLTFGTTGLFKKTIKIVAEIVPPELNVDEIKNNLLYKIHHVIDIHDIHVWTLADDINIAVMHVIIDSESQRKNVIKDITNFMIAYGVYSNTIQIECRDDLPHIIHEKKNCCAFASQFNHKMRIFNSNPAYQHLIGCKHIAAIENSYEDSYEDINEKSNTETTNANDALTVDSGPSRSGSCSIIEKVCFDKHHDIKNLKSGIEVEEED